VASVGSVPARPCGRRVLDLARRQVLRLHVLVLHSRLDRALAGGADPASQAALGLRAAQLLRPRYRRRLAASVERLVDDLDANRGWWLSAAIPYLHDQGAEARGTLLSLAFALRASERVQPRGVAMVDKLVRDPTSSPLFVRTARGALQLQAQTALECLLGQRLADPEAWPAGLPEMEERPHGGR
jgi:hypothetical protein